jgi:hypothetical protein
MQTHSYQYHPLAAGRREIRLLELQPGRYDELLNCRLAIVSLTSNPNYNALSYVWGDHVGFAPAEPEIILDGHHFPVTPNLYSALKHLRSTAKRNPMVLWVDAVCINQNDLDERNQQVAMMRDIYASATHVTIWLGEADDDSGVALDALSMILGQESWPEDPKVRSAIRLHCANFFFGLSTRRSWLSRVWILQELAMSKNDPDVVCGYKRVAWSILVAAWQTIAKEALVDWGARRKVPKVADKPDQDDDIELFTLTKLDVLHELRQAIQMRGGEKLKKLLLSTRTSEATDPRDRIYGILGLLQPGSSSPGSDSPVIVDYHKSCSEVYIDVMAHIFSLGEGPYFLSGVFLSGGPAAAPHIPSLPATKLQQYLPSWVPDFSRQTFEKATQPEGYHFHPPTTMHASGAGQGANNGTIVGDGRTLQVEGLIVDTIVDVTTFGPSLEAVKDNLPQFETMASRARSRPGSFAPSITPLMLRFRESEPLWRILISNKHLKSGYEPAPSSYEAMYSDLLAGKKPPKTDGEARKASDTSAMNEYEQRLHSCAGNKAFFTTTNGFIGTCVPDSREGDIVVIVFSSPSPFVLRPLPVDSDGVQRYWLIGCSYVGGIMNGEMVDELYCEDLMDSTTFLVQ